MRHLVLVVEDEPALAALLRRNLEREGLDVYEAHDAEAALLQLYARRPHVVLLDWTLARVSGLDLCHQIRRDPAWRDLPVIMLMAHSDEADNVKALDDGADDCVVKPFSPSELAARVRALIRRARMPTAPETLHFADIVMNLVAHRVTRDGTAIHLSPIEFRLLRFFLERPRQVFSREQLLEGVWGEAGPDLRTVDVHIRRLRRALDIGNRPDLIRTVRTAGYVLDLAVTQPPRAGRIREDVERSTGQPLPKIEDKSDDHSSLSINLDGRSVRCS
jgi:two-component system, OmpR family, phosphate regulon response regulator PhoB